MKEIRARGGKSQYIVRYARERCFMKYVHSKEARVDKICFTANATSKRILEIGLMKKTKKIKKQQEICMLIK